MELTGHRLPVVSQVVVVRIVRRKYLPAAGLVRGRADRLDAGDGFLGAERHHDAAAWVGGFHVVLLLLQDDVVLVVVLLVLLLQLMMVLLLLQVMVMVVLVVMLLLLLVDDRHERGTAVVVLVVMVVLLLMRRLLLLQHHRVARGQHVVLVVRVVHGAVVAAGRLVGPDGTGLRDRGWLAGWGGGRGAGRSRRSVVGRPENVSSRRVRRLHGPLSSSSRAYVPACFTTARTSGTRTGTTAAAGPRSRRRRDR